MFKCYFPPSTIANSFTLAVLNSPRCCFVRRDIICDNGIHPLLNSLAENEAERGKIKWGQIFHCIRTV